MEVFFSTAARCRVRYHDFPGCGMPLLFIHGLGCAGSYDYPRVVADAAFGRRRAIVIDLPGSGYSDKPRVHDYSTSQQALVVDELIQHLNLPHVWLYGHSMGGSIAIEVAARLASQICSLVVSEPNLQAGGGTFSLGIAALRRSRKLGLLRRDLRRWSTPKHRPGQGACRRPHPGRYGPLAALTAFSHQSRQRYSAPGCYRKLGRRQIIALPAAAITYSARRDRWRADPADADRLCFPLPGYIALPVSRKRSGLPHQVKKSLSTARCAASSAVSQPHTRPENGAYQSTRSPASLIWGMARQSVSAGSWRRRSASRICSAALNTDCPLSPIG